MNFVHKHWADFCEKLHEAGIHSVPAMYVTEQLHDYLVLKHDVETDVSKAYAIAEIEQTYGHKGSFYVQAYLLDQEKNVQLLKRMQKMGHEITYHHDVMDSCKGDLEAAISEFDRNKRKFEESGFRINTVCQHGNPVIERIGYTSNRDFFRSAQVRERYPTISDIMVNFKENHRTEYAYYSDAGRQFHMIYDPLNNDIRNSDDKNVAYDDLAALFSVIADGGNHIISIHPHRWSSSEMQYIVQTRFFKSVKGIAKALMKVPGMRKLMGRFYFLAKKV